MSVVEARKLTCYFGERHRFGGRFVADALLDLFAERHLEVGVMFRGVEGFGLKHHLRTDVSLSLSEDLPAVAIAVDRSAIVEPLLGSVRTLPGIGMTTVERARLVSFTDGPGLDPAEFAEPVRLSAFVGRNRRVGGAPAYVAACEILYRRGVSGATVLLGVDGTVRGRRERAALIGSNLDVPAMVLAVGGGPQIAAALGELGTVLPQAPLTLERVTLCKRDGVPLARPPRLPDADLHGRPMWQKISVFSSEAALSGGRPLHRRLTRELQRAGARGVTSLRGVWGFHGDHRPHGDRLWQLGRRVPTLTVAIDRPGAVARWYPVVDELTADGGLVISEFVPHAGA
jgi:PII-like signaling protein